MTPSCRRSRLGRTLLVGLCCGALGGCQPAATGGSPSACAAVALPGVDVSDLTVREHCEWSQLVTELLAPCSDQAVTLRECVEQSRPCAACRPASDWLARQVRSGKPKGDVVELFAARFDPARVKTIVVGDSPVRGRADAPVTIFEWADYECPACGGLAPLVHELLTRHGSDVRFVFKHFPISYHPNALMAARAAVAAGKQGKFWQMHDRLFEQRGRLAQGDLEALAAELGLDPVQFRADLEADATAEQVKRDKAQGESLGVSATPTLFINGREVSMRSFTDATRELEEWIVLDAELARKNPAEARP